ncbi:hypothetical protein CK203_064524 [Vitis vinifera]|uniref:Uncharacterized protein n=1 Tax=Vitis vinifera TaxID=29760 RepID=A0A438G7P8_VITVI|nr:hypothetical protein CK203_064524 [Vitis vinifera]
MISRTIALSSSSWLVSFFSVSQHVLVKEVVRIYLHYIRAVHVRKVRAEAETEALNEGFSQGLSYEDSSKQACEKGDAAARRAYLQAKHIMGHLISSGWDVFETLYVGGTITEGLIRAVVHCWITCRCYIGEQRLGWIGSLVGSHMGSWVGGRIGLMAYDVGNGVQYLLQLVGKEHSSNGSSSSRVLCFSAEKGRSIRCLLMN